MQFEDFDRPEMYSTNYRFPVTSNLNIDDEISSDIDRLVLTHPEKIWDRTCPLPNASSSPNWRLQTRSFDSELDDKENCPNVSELELYKFINYI